MKVSFIPAGRLPHLREDMNEPPTRMTIRLSVKEDSRKQ